MASREEKLKKLEENKNKPGFKHSPVSISTKSGPVTINLHGPKEFISVMEKKVTTVGNASYNKKMFSVLAKSKIPIYIFYIESRRLLGTGYIDKPGKGWFSSSIKTHLYMYFHQKGYVEKIPFEVLRGNKVYRVKEFDEVKYTLAHEFFHLWTYADPKSYPRKGNVGAMYKNLRLQGECWATRYTNGWRYQQKKYVRYIYRDGLTNYNVDSIHKYR